MASYQLAQRGWWLWCHWGLQWYLHQPAWWPAGISGYSLRSPERGAPKGGAGAAGPGAGGAGCPAAPEKPGRGSVRTVPLGAEIRSSVTHHFSSYTGNAHSRTAAACDPRESTEIAAAGMEPGLVVPLSWILVVRAGGRDGAEAAPRRRVLYARSEAVQRAGRGLRG